MMNDVTHMAAQINDFETRFFLNELKEKNTK